MAEVTSPGAALRAAPFAPAASLRARWRACSLRSSLPAADGARCGYSLYTVSSTGNCPPGEASGLPSRRLPFSRRLNRSFEFVGRFRVASVHATHAMRAQSRTPDPAHRVSAGCTLSFNPQVPGSSPGGPTDNPSAAQRPGDLCLRWVSGEKRCNGMTIPRAQA